MSFGLQHKVCAGDRAQDDPKRTKDIQLSQLPLQLIPERKIYSVAEVSAALRGLLEQKFPDVWVTGEISNLRSAGSGHIYFTLRDATAQLRAVCFRNQARYLKLKPQDGISVIARGRLSVYEARGEYQLLVEYLEPAGLGALQLAFERLKQKLGAEGLFDAARKRPLPLLPRAVGVVTSPDGAALRDILRVLRRRFRNMDVWIYPARVQGEGATEEIAQGIVYFSRHRPVDVVIVGRGGGSLEDLWAFNEEIVARAMAASTVPIISAVGHETDFTIADFVADLRAPTPSAAAEMVVHPKQDFVAELQNRTRHMAQLIRLRLSEAWSNLAKLALSRAFQTLAGRVRERAQRVDEATAALDRLLRQKLHESHQAWATASSGILRYDFRRLLQLKRAALEERSARVSGQFTSRLTAQRNRLAQLQALLTERSPLTVLARGYSITRDAQGRIVRDAAQVELGEKIAVRLARGELGATVRQK